MNDEKTHYRKAFDSPYLSSADIVDPVVLTIKQVVLEADRTKQSKDRFNTAYFVEREIRAGEPLKPMILNATNSKFLAGLVGSKFIDDWVDVTVEVWVDNNVRYGKETVEGLRLARAPMPPPAESMRQAREASLAGTKALKEWWEQQVEATRTVMLPALKGLRAAAKAADGVKT